MSAEFNSKLIDKLYQEFDPDKATLISDEMVEINDAIFIYPIFAAYKKFQKTTVSHYFIADLMEFKQEDSVRILKELCEDELALERNLSYLTDFCIKNDYLTEKFTKKVKESFLVNKNLDDFDEYDLTEYLDYFLFAKIFEEVEEVVRDIYEKTEIGKYLPKTALRYLLKYNREKYFQYYYDNYQLIKEKKAEIILAEEVCLWKGDIINKIKEKILKDGSARAKEIINEKIEKEKQLENKKASQKVEEIKNKFDNIEIINEIVNIRRKINLLTAGNKLFNFQLLLDSELLLKHLCSANSGPEMVDFALDFREIIQGINKEVGKHGYSLEDAKKIIKDITEFASINNLHLFLVAKGIKVDENLFELRNLNNVLSKIAHPKNQEKLSKALQKIECYDLYTNENWSELSIKLLKMYKNFLLKLEEIIKTIK